MEPTTFKASSIVLSTLSDPASSDDVLKETKLKINEDKLNKPSSTNEGGEDMY